MRWLLVSLAPVPSRPSAPADRQDISVGPDGLPWVVNSDGRFLRLVPSKGQNRYEDPAVQWPNITPAGRTAKDIGPGTGATMSAFVTTDQYIYGWNGRLPTSSGGAMPDWEDVGGIAARVATGPDGRPWVVTVNADLFRLGPRDNAVCVFTTNDAGKARGTARAADGSLFQDEHVWINGSTDLRNVIKGNSGACVYGIWLTRSVIPGVFYTLHIDGQGRDRLGVDVHLYRGRGRLHRLQAVLRARPPHAHDRLQRHQGRHQTHQLVGRQRPEVGSALQPSSGGHGPSTGLRPDVGLWMAR